MTLTTPSNARVARGTPAPTASKMLSQVCVLLAVSLYCLHEQDVVTGLCFTCRLPLLFTRARCCHRSVFYLPSPSTVYTSKMLSQVCVLLAVSLYCLHAIYLVTSQGRSTFNNAISLHVCIQCNLLSYKLLNMIQRQTVLIYTRRSQTYV